LTQLLTDKTAEAIREKGAMVIVPSSAIETIIRPDRIFGHPFNVFFRYANSGDGRQLEVPVNDKQNSRCNDN
jgi:hypothetical protein